MSRKKTQGEPVAFRLPLREDAAFRAKAKLEGISPGQYARKIILSQ